MNMRTLMVGVLVAMSMTLATIPTASAGDGNCLGWDWDMVETSFVWESSLAGGGCTGYWYQDLYKPNEVGDCIGSHIGNETDGHCTGVQF